MNVLFLIIFIVCGAVFAASSPEAFFSALTQGGEKAVILSAKLIAVYAVSMGIIKIAEEAGLLKKLSRLLLPLNKKLFGCDDETTCGFISANMSANILGMGSVATPMGISAMQGLLKSKNSDYASSMFFVINAVGLQVLPLSVIALRSSAGSLSPSDIILPTILTLLVSLTVSLTLVGIFIKRR